MLDTVKVGFQVKINDSGLLLTDRLSDSIDRLMRCPFWSVTIRSRLEISFENRFQNELERTLYYPIANRGNREDANFCASVLGDFLPSRPQGPIRIGDQLVLNLFQKTLYST